MPACRGEKTNFGLLNKIQLAVFLSYMDWKAGTLRENLSLQKNISVRTQGCG